MLVRVAYIGVIIIWSTTPLAIQWSSMGGGVLFAVSARMLIGLLVLYTIFKVTRLSLPISKPAIKVYIVSGLGIFTSMAAVYWGAQFIPSGWIAVVFGLSPIVTGVLSKVLYRQKSFSVMKLIGIVFGLAGLMTIFGYSSEFSVDATWGIIAIVVSTITHALSAVVIKHINAPLTGVEATHGGLIVAVPLFLTSMLISNEQISLEVPVVAWIAILYLGVIATALGFSMYYFILKNMDAIKVSMITLVTPVTALLLGALFNNEPLSVSILMGALLVVLGLAVFEFDKDIYRLITRFLSRPNCASK
jgi:drug/metabolite transporter (DMT)-like permease